MILFPKTQSIFILGKRFALFAQTDNLWYDIDRLTNEMYSNLLADSPPKPPSIPDAASGSAVHLNE